MIDLWLLDSNVSGGFKLRSCFGTKEFQRIGAKLRSHIENEGFEAPSWGIFWNQRQNGHRHLSKLEKKYIYNLQLLMRTCLKMMQV